MTDGHISLAAMTSVLYLFIYSHYRKQYVGETTDRFRHIWNNYTSNNRTFARNEVCMQKHLFRSFNCEGHKDFLENVSTM